MKAIHEYTAEDILKMDYNQLIGLVKETNRPPGGFKSISKIAQMAFLNKDSRVLEIGTSTGITAIELARLVGCKINAIDINPNSIEEAKKRAQEEGVGHLIDFEVQDATHTNFGDNYFDLVFCGNVTSLISRREEALKEYIRTLKKSGFIGAIPMYYIRQPSKQLLQDVRDAIQVDIIAWDKSFWLNFFKKDVLEILWFEDYKFDYIEDNAVNNFSGRILEREHLKALKPEVKEILQGKYTRYMLLFRDNLSYMGFSSILLRKCDMNLDAELFTSSLYEGEIWNPFQ